MRKKLTVNLDKNPFIYFKIRNALLWFIVISFLVGIQYALIMCFTGQDINNLDPIFDMMFGIIIILLWIAYIVRKLTSYRLDWHRFVGKIPRNHDWLSFGLLGIMSYHLLSEQIELSVTLFQYFFHLGCIRSILMQLY